MNTLRIHVDRELRQEFKQKCLKNKNTMSKEIRKFMKWYIKEK